jgi:glycerate dehydrogenase
MTIVITDGQTLNPGDLDWSAFEKLGSVRYFDTTAPAEVVDRCMDADIIVTNKTIIPSELIKNSRSLKLVAVSATGFNNVDVAAAKEKGVAVCNVPEYGTWSVAQHTFALILELTNRVGLNVQSTKRDEWAHEQWSYTRAPIIELRDKVLGIVGLGRIGNQVAKLAEAFGMTVVFHNRSRLIHSSARQVKLGELFRKSDVVSLHCPLTGDNKGFVNRELLSTMKKNAFLINTSRGPLINEQDLVDALNEGHLAGAALDVLSQEPPAANHPLIHHPRCIVTPHNAWISFEARRRLMMETLENVRAFVEGRIRNRVA